jgi:small-conductance mechanosensitive channel
MPEFLGRNIFGNTVETYLKAAGMIIVGIFVVWLVKTIVLQRLRKWAKKTHTSIDDFILVSVDKYLVPIFYFGIVYLGINGLHLNPSVVKALSAAASMLVAIVGILFLNSLLRFAIFDVYLGKNTERMMMANRFHSLMPALTVTIWIIGSIFLLDNLGFKISAIVAGLGIGGVAVALAASTVLADLFAYFIIMFDRPFVIGDFIIIDDFMGSIEHIGIKTTRLRSLGGELLIFSNKDLTNARVRNYKVMQERRVVFRFSVTYDTPLEKLKEIAPLVQSIVKSIPGTRFDRAHFFSFGDFNLVFEVVYYVLSPDYNKYMDIQQAINYAIKDELDKRKVEFAFPTQTLYLQPPHKEKPVANPAS